MQIFERTKGRKKMLCRRLAGKGNMPHDFILGFHPDHYHKS